MPYPVKIGVSSYTLAQQIIHRKYHTFKLYMCTTKYVVVFISSSRDKSLQACSCTLFVSVHKRFVSAEKVNFSCPNPHSLSTAQGISGSISSFGRLIVVKSEV